MHWQASTISSPPSRELEQAIQLDPSRAPSYANLGLWNWLEVGATPRSRRSSVRSRSTRKWLVGHLALGQHYWAAGKLENAKEAFLKARSLNAEDPLVNRTLALFSLATGDVAGAEQYLKAVAKARPAGTLLLADYYMATGRTKEAIARSSNLSRPGPSPRRPAPPGSRLRFTGRHEESAHTIVDGLLARDAQDAETLLLKGQLLLADGNRDAAFERVTGAAERAPNSVPVLFALGKLQASRGDLDAARNSYNRVLQLNSRAVPAQLELARLYLAEGNADNSARAANDALSNEPASLEARSALVRGPSRERRCWRSEHARAGDDQAISQLRLRAVVARTLAARTR
jgi:tetratricopeptide (TPR) repeat protein